MSKNLFDLIELYSTAYTDRLRFSNNDESEACKFASAQLIETIIANEGKVVQGHPAEMVVLGYAAALVESIRKCVSSDGSFIDGKGRVFTRDFAWPSNGR